MHTLSRSIYFSFIFTLLLHRRWTSGDKITRTRNQWVLEAFFFQFTTRRRIPMPILMNILIMVLVYLVFFLFGRPKEKNAYTCITVSIAVTIHLLLISTCMWSRLFKLTACSTLRTLPIPIAIAHALIHYHSTQSAIVRIDCDIVWEKWKIHFF